MNRQQRDEGDDDHVFRAMGAPTQWFPLRTRAREGRAAEVVELLRDQVAASRRGLEQAHPQRETGRASGRPACRRTGD